MKMKLMALAVCASFWAGCQDAVHEPQGVPMADVDDVSPADTTDTGMPDAGSGQPDTSPAMDMGGGQDVDDGGNTDVAVCIPSCAGKSCGEWNGCDAYCTACPSGQTCIDHTTYHKCEPVVQPECTKDADCTQPANPCLEATCNEFGKCVTGPCVDHIACDDGNVCTSGDTCQAGACVGTQIANCPAVDLCKDVVCDVGGGCGCKGNVWECSGFTDKCDPATGQCITSYSAEDCAAKGQICSVDVGGCAAPVVPVDATPSLEVDFFDNEKPNISQIMLEGEHCEATAKPNYTSEPLGGIEGCGLYQGWGEYTDKVTGKPTSWGGNELSAGYVATQIDAPNGVELLVFHAWARFNSDPGKPLKSLMPTTETLTPITSGVITLTNGWVVKAKFGDQPATCKILFNFWKNGVNAWCWRKS